MAGTAYESRVRLPSGSAVLVRLEVAEDDAYDDQGELAEVAQMVASTTSVVLKSHLHRDPDDVAGDPWGPVRPDPFLTTDISGATQTREQPIGVDEPPC